MEPRRKDDLTKILLALLAGAATPVTFFSLLILLSPYQLVDRTYFLYVGIAFAVTLAHAVILGVPAFVLLKRLHTTKWYIAIIGGFIIGFIPTAIFSWPLGKLSPGFSAGDSWGQSVINGVPTNLGWIEYVIGSCVAGLFGAAGAGSFWSVWRYLPPKIEINWKNKKTVGSIATVLLVLLSIYIFKRPIPLEKDPWFIERLAKAEGGAPEPAWQLSLEYQGRFMVSGDKRDQDEAQKWGRVAADAWRQMAESGSTGAQVGLAGIYEGNVGVKQDWAEAYFWFSVATLKDSQYAIDANVASERLTPEQISEVNKRVSEWKLAHDSPEEGKH